jgi:glycosyltransferase involved in cell wall biosynthesis
MKVLHVYRTYFPDSQGGLEEVIRQICLSTQAHGVQSRIFSLSVDPRPGFIDAEEGQIVRVKRSFEIASCGFCFGGLVEFRRQVEWADIVHYHFPWPFADVMHALAGYPHPSIITYHSDVVRQRLLMVLYRPLMLHFLGTMDRIITTSPNYYATSDVLSRFSKKVDIIPIGIDRDSYPVMEDESERLQQVEAEYGRGFFLFVGVLRYYKGLHILLEAIRKAPYRVVIVGSGAMESELRAQAQELKLENVQFSGYVDDETKMALFTLCRSVVFPSYMRSEAFGVTLLEGAMCGKPLISAEVGSGTSHINIHERTGLVVTPGCPSSLREAMDTVYHRPLLAEEMGRQAQARYQELFTGFAMGQSYARVYGEVRSAHDAERNVSLASTD